MIKTILMCDWPGCERVKSDLVWWESNVGEGVWNRTVDGRDWCGRHSRDEISLLLDNESSV